MPFQLLHPKSKSAPHRPSAPEAASLTLLPLANRSGRCATAVVPEDSRRPTSTTKAHRKIKLKPKGRIGAPAQKPKLDSRQTNLDTLLHGNAVAQNCSASAAASCQNRDTVDDCNLQETCDGAMPPLCYDSYVGNLKKDIDSGVLDLRGCPWVHPSEPCVEVMRINKLRRPAAS